MNRAEALALVKAAPMASSALCIKTHRAAPILRAVCCPDQIGNTAVTPKSRENNFGREFDMLGFRRAFPDRWGHVCRTHYGDAETLMDVTGCDRRTAEYWLRGEHAPAAAFLLRVVTDHPEAINTLLNGDD